MTTLKMLQIRKERLDDEPDADPMIVAYIQDVDADGLGKPFAFLDAGLVDVDPRLYEVWKAALSLWLERFNESITGMKCVAVDVDPRQKPS